MLMEITIPTVRASAIAFNNVKMVKAQTINLVFLSTDACGIEWFSKRVPGESQPKDLSAIAVPNHIMPFIP